MPSQAVYLYVHITVPLQVNEAGVELDPTRVGVTVLPQASVMLAGAPGSVALAGHETVAVVLDGAVKPPL